MSTLFICTNCGLESRVQSVGVGVDGKLKTIDCICCKTIMSEAGPGGRPASSLRKMVKNPHHLHKDSYPD